MYKLIYTKEALKHLSKLNKEIYIRILNSLKRCQIRPHSHVKKLVGNPYFSLRVGDYRVIMAIKDDQLIILVIEIGHRKKIYKKID